MPVTYTFPGPGPSASSGTSKYPNAIDDQLSMPLTVDLITPISAIVVNRLRDAIIAVQSELGTQPSGTFGTVRARLDDLRSEITTINAAIVALQAADVALAALIDGALKAPVLANQIDESQRITIPLALNENIAVNVFTAIGGDVFDPSTIPNPSSSRVITFNATINTSLAATQAQIRLFNVTDGVVVTGTEFSSISLTPELNTIVLGVPAALPNAAKTYEVQLRTATAAVAFCQKAELIITWT
jgi:hypothetical protein